TSYGDWSSDVCSSDLFRESNDLDTFKEDSMKRLSVLTAILVATGFAAPASAGGINLNGPHYNLNIIGVENPKTAPMTGSDRHTRSEERRVGNCRTAP